MEKLLVLNSTHLQIDFTHHLTPTHNNNNHLSETLQPKHSEEVEGVKVDQTPITLTPSTIKLSYNLVNPMGTLRETQGFPLPSQETPVPIKTLDKD